MVLFTLQDSQAQASRNDDFRQLLPLEVQGLLLMINVWLGSSRGHFTWAETLVRAWRVRELMFGFLVPYL